MSSADTMNHCPSLWKVPRGNIFPSVFVFWNTSTSPPATAVSIRAGPLQTFSPVHRLECLLLRLINNTSQTLTQPLPSSRWVEFRFGDSVSLSDGVSVLAEGINASSSNSSHSGESLRFKGRVELGWDTKDDVSFFFSFFFNCGKKQGVSWSYSTGEYDMGLKCVMQQCYCTLDTTKLWAYK